MIPSRLHLGCGEEARVSDTDVVLIELHGLGGDSWAADNAAGARVRVAPLSGPTARDLIRHGVPTLADEACTGTGAGIRVPVRRPSGSRIFDLGTKSRNLGDLPRSGGLRQR